MLGSNVRPFGGQQGIVFRGRVFMHDGRGGVGHHVPGVRANFAVFDMLWMLHASDHFGVRDVMFDMVRSTADVVPRWA